MQEMLQAANLLLLWHGGDLSLLGSKDLSHKPPNIQHNVAVIRLGFLSILNRAVFGEISWSYLGLLHESPYVAEGWAEVECKVVQEDYQ